MQVPGGDNAGLRSDIVWLELMSEEKETLLVKKKANDSLLEFITIELSWIVARPWDISSEMLLIPDCVEQH